MYFYRYRIVWRLLADRHIPGAVGHLQKICYLVMDVYSHIFNSYFNSYWNVFRKEHAFEKEIKAGAVVLSHIKRQAVHAEEHMDFLFEECQEPSLGIFELLIDVFEAFSVRYKIQGLINKVNICGGPSRKRLPDGPLYPCW